MFKLENAIAEWRQRMAAEGMDEPERLNELEAHLRDDLDALRASGMSDAEAFAEAIRRLGPAGELSEEFKRAGSPKDSLGRTHEIAIKVLAVWFILTGCGYLLGSRWIFRGNVFNFDWTTLSMLLCLMPLPLGIGLLRQRNFWRYLSIAWCVWLSAGSLATVLIPTLRPSSWLIYAPPAHHALVSYGVLGVPASYDVFYVFRIICVLMWTFGACLLLAPRSRKYFSAARA